MAERPGVDTELARLLHRTARVDLATLRGTLEEARRQRQGAGASLAQMLVQRGLVSPAEVASLLGQVQPGATSSDVRPPPPSGTWSELPAVPRSGTGTEIARWATSSADQSRAGPGTGRPSGRLPGRPSGSWEIRPAEATEVGRPAEPERLEAWRTGGRIGDYVLERQAGAGAMGVVFIARHAHTGGRYAIKTLRNGEDPTLVERFRREGEAQAKVDGHQNVARVHSMGEAHGRLYIVMELVEGDNLDERIKRGTPPWPEAARIVAGVARGLAHMHARGVLHRDLKPSNVLFDADGVPKLVDFGLARSAGADRLTLTGEVVGTPAFMAPEQALGHREKIGPWTDVWALGGVLFYVLTGRVPFDGTTSLQVITRVAEEEAPTPRSVRADVPPELDALCRSLMKRPTGERLTAAKAAERLEAYAVAASAAPDAAPAPGASRGFLALAGVAVVALVAGVAALAVAGSSRGDPSPPPPPATSAVAVDGPASGSSERPPAPAAPIEPWVVGQVRRCVVTATIEGEYRELMSRMQLWLSERLDMRWTVTSVEAGRVGVEATIEALALGTVLKPVDREGEVRWQVDFDSRRDAGSGSPYHAVVGAKLTLVLDARSGEVLELHGAEEAQRAVFEAAKRDAPPTAGDEEGGEQGGGGRARRDAENVVPLLADAEALRGTLNGALHVFPADPAAARARWSVVRAPELAGPYWPGGLTVEVDVRADDDEPALRWSGTRRATFRPPWLQDAKGTVVRTVNGRAALTPARDRVASGSFKETWRSEIEGRDGLGMQGVYEFEVTLTDGP